MTINIISQTTAERNAETEQLFQDCKPYLDKGYSLGKAVQTTLQLKHTTFYNMKWYKDLRTYAEQQGYQGRK